MNALREEVVSLNARLTEASEAYYKKNQPILTDAEFDTLERRLKTLVADSPLLAGLAPFLTAVGNDITASGRVSHARPMLSIENKYEEQDLIDWYAGLPGAPAVCLEPKFDGISVSLLYKNRHLVRALTRGDGKSGEDITAQVHAVVSIPKILTADLPSELEVRGELVMRNSTLERLNKKAEEKGGKIYSSTRNLTGGTMKLKDTSLIPDRDIQIMPWDVLGDDNALPDSGFERLALLTKSGFPEPLGGLAYDGVSVGMLLHRKLMERQTVLRDVMSLETDGVVIKVDSHSLRAKLGVGSKYTNYQVCFKPQSARGETYLREVIWQVGRSGKLTPVGVVDPINLAGATITHVTLNNITWIRTIGLKLNSRISLIRSGDVIPLVEKVLDGDIE